MQAAGVGSLVAGCFTANHLIIVIDTIMPILRIPLPDFINAANPNIIPYTQGSAGLAIVAGLVSIFMASSIILRIGKFKLGAAGKLFMLLVRNLCVAYTHS